MNNMKFTMSSTNVAGCLRDCAIIIGKGAGEGVGKPKGGIGENQDERGGYVVDVNFIHSEGAVLFSFPYIIWKKGRRAIRVFIIQAERFLNADWLKRAAFISNTCHIWERVVFQGFDFPFIIWKRVVFQGLEILLSSKYGNMKVPARQTRWRTILSFSVCTCGHFNGISRQSAQKTRNMESKLLLCGVTELKRGLHCLNISK